MLVIVLPPEFVICASSMYAEHLHVLGSAQPLQKATAKWPIMRTECDQSGRINTGCPKKC